MISSATKIDRAYHLSPRFFGDARGFFLKETSPNSLSMPTSFRIITADGEIVPPGPVDALQSL